MAGWRSCCAPARSGSTAAAPRPATAWPRGSSCACRPWATLGARARRGSADADADRATRRCCCRRRAPSRRRGDRHRQARRASRCRAAPASDRHLDALLDALRFGAAERPRLVHRLDKDTSGVLVLARSAAAAAELAAAFRGKAVRKVYWALTVGVPKPRQGRIDLPLAKLPGGAGERVVADDEDGKRALTYYRTVAHAGDKIAWLALEPVTGRTHQLRAHCGRDRHADPRRRQVWRRRRPSRRRAAARGSSISTPAPSSFPHPDGRRLTVTAPLPPHMRETWAVLRLRRSRRARSLRRSRAR